ncbi:MAG TPA: GAF domain-containing protein [Candidatus Limnocylindrales bacterium]
MESQRVVFSASIGAWGDAIAEELVREYPYGYCGVLLYDAVADGLLVVGQRYATGEESRGMVVGEAVVPLDSVTGSVFRTGSPALLSDVRSHPSYRALAGTQPGSELAVPLLRDGRAIGAINVESPRIGGLGIEDLERLLRAAERAVATFPGRSEASRS